MGRLTGLTDRDMVDRVRDGLPVKEKRLGCRQQVWKGTHFIFTDSMVTVKLSEAEEEKHQDL